MKGNESKTSLMRSGDPLYFLISSNRLRTVQFKKKEMHQMHPLTTVCGILLKLVVAIISVLFTLCLLVDNVRHFFSWHKFAVAPFWKPRIHSKL